jgi:hypothetical protein
MIGYGALGGQADQLKGSTRRVLTFNVQLDLSTGQGATEAFNWSSF